MIEIFSRCLEFLSILSVVAIVGFAQQVPADFRSQPAKGVSKINDSVSLAKLSIVDDYYKLGQEAFRTGLNLIEAESDNSPSALKAFKIAAENLEKDKREQSKVLYAKSLLQISSILIRNPTGETDSEALRNIREAYNLANLLSQKTLNGLIYKSLGIYFFYQREYTSSIAAFEKAEPILAQDRDYDSLLEIYTFSMFTFRNLYIRDEALNFQAKAIRLLDFAKSKRKQMSAIFAIGEVYNSNGESIEAIKQYEQARRIAVALQDQKRVLSIKYTIGRTHLWEGNYHDAESTFIDLLRIAGALPSTDKDFLRRTKIGLASAFGQQGKFGAADEMFSNLEPDIGNSLDTKYNFYNGFAHLQLSKKDYQRAKKYFELALQNADPKAIDSISDVKVQLLLISYKLRSLSAEQTIEKLDQSISKVKDEQLNSRNIGINLSYLEEYIFPFKFKTAVQIESGDIEGALLHSDSYKSRWLIGKLTAGSDFGFVNRNWISSEKAKSLRDKIFERLIVSAIDGNDEKDVALNAMIAEHDESLNQKEDVSALTQKLRSAELSGSELAQLSSSIGQRAILSFSFTDEFLSIFLIQANQPIKNFTVAISERNLSEKVKVWTSKIANRDLAFKKDARELFNLLISPLESDLKHVSDLIIVPENCLWRLPFQALLDSEGKYLIESHPVSYVPSLKVLSTIRSRNTEVFTDSDEVAGFGNPQTDGNKLLEAESEVNHLLNIYSNTYLMTRNNATETALKNEMPRAKILHVAAHGKLDENEPMRSSISLASDKINDGNLEVGEIIGLKSSPKLVILSACSTIKGQLFKGEGLLSLTWAFLVAGSNNVIGTSWDIDDKATSDQMKIFHESFKKSGSISRSLQAATISQIRKKGLQNHPFYWAGFVSVGGF
jgi:CHAT domain-containing protein